MKFANKRLILRIGTIGSVIAAGVTWIFGDMLGGTNGLILFLASLVSIGIFGFSLLRVNKAPAKSAGVVFPESAPVVSFEDNGAVIRFEFWNKEGSRIISNNDRGKAADLGKAMKRTVYVDNKVYLADVIDGDRGVGLNMEMRAGPRDIRRFLKFPDGQELELPPDEKLPADVKTQIAEGLKAGKMDLLKVDMGPLTRLLLDITNTAEEAWAFLESSKMARTYTEDITGRSKVMFMGIGFIIAVMIRVIFGI